MHVNRHMRWTFGVLLALSAAPTLAADYVALPGGTFVSVLPADGKAAPARIAPFRLRTEPVTNAEFLAFVNWVQTHGRNGR